MKIFLTLSLCLALSLSAPAQDWRKMTEDELKKSVPEKAPVVKEKIETEIRTASGIADGKNNIFGVAVITAGYDADGKYSHFFKTDAKIKVGDLSLEKGEYLFGSQRLDAETLGVRFYKANDGKLVGTVKAKTDPNKKGIRSFLIEPAAAKKGKIYIGRFAFEYSL